MDKTTAVVLSILESTEHLDLHEQTPQFANRLRAADYSGALAALRAAMEADQELVSPATTGPLNRQEALQARQNWYGLRLIEARVSELAAARDRQRLTPHDPNETPYDSISFA